MITVNIGFNGNDETQFDVESLYELAELFAVFCEENGIEDAQIDYIETV